MRHPKKIKIIIISWLICLTASVSPSAPSGSLKWRAKVGGTSFGAAGPGLAAGEVSVFGFQTGGPVGESSPAIGPDSSVYVGSYDHFLYALAADGTLKWKFETGGRIFSSPAVTTGGTIIFGSGDNFVYAVANDGSLKWRFETGGPCFSSVALGLDGTIYAAPWDGYLYAINPDGSLKWKLELGKTEASHTVRAGPVVDTEGTVYLGADGLYAVNPQGNLKWSFGEQGNRPTNPAAVGADGTIYFPTLTALYAVGPDGGLKWSFPAGGMSSAALDDQGNVYFGAADNSLYSVSPDGTLRWSYSAGAEVRSSPALGADNTVYFGSLDSLLYAVSTEGELKWALKTGGDVNSSPALTADGMIYVGSLNGYLYAVDTGSDSGAMVSPWPEFGHDSRNTFRAAGELSAGDFKFYFATKDTISSSPAIGMDGTIYFGSWDAYLYALSAEGLLKWKFQAAGAISASPAIGADSTIYFGSWGDKFYALDPNGTLKWELFLPGDVRGSAALAPDGTIYFGHRNKLHAVNSAGRLKWTFQPDDDINPPAIGEDGTIYYVSGGDGFHLYAVYPNGALKWKFRLEHSTTGGVSIGPDSTVYVSAVDLFAVNPDGTLKWKYQADLFGNKSFKLTPIIGPDSTVYAAGQDRCLYALNSDGTLKWRTKTGAGAVMPPVIGADETIYLATFDYAVFALAADGSIKWTKPLGRKLEYRYPNSPALGPGGTLYLGTWNNALLAIETGTGVGLATEGWPKVGRNSRNTGSLAETYTPPVKSCDFSSDGLIAIGDVIFFLLLARDHPGDPRLDWTGDGVYQINDAVALMLDIHHGNCPEQVPEEPAPEEPAPELASAASVEDIERIGMLSAADIEYLEEIFSQLPLKPEELSALRLALHGEPADAPALPRAFSLSQNFPNPFNPSTTISYAVPEGSGERVTLNIYDLRGALVRTLVDSERGPGTHTAFWDGTDGSGRRLPSGVYFYRIKAGDFLQMRKMVLLK